MEFGGLEDSPYSHVVAFRSSNRYREHSWLEDRYNRGTVLCQVLTSIFILIFIIINFLIVHFFFYFFFGGGDLVTLEGDVCTRDGMNTEHWSGPTIVQKTDCCHV
uniref:Transmembrane protein n=1 Tax=Opuntia streptacantha TaxID=393608 RepID=A0A7C9F704_OPUST